MKSEQDRDQEGSIDEPPADPLSILSERQLQVLRLVARGLTNKQVASELGLSVYTVETHMKNIFAKLKVPNRGAAIRFAIDNKIDEPRKRRR